MKKKILAVFIILVPLVILSVLIVRNKTTTPEKSSAQGPVLSATDQTQNVTTMGNYAFAWYESDPVTLKLIANFTQKQTSGDVMNKNNCRFLSNASFYSQDNKPLGLFITNGNTLADFQNNSLFDGILSINDMATPRITRDLPQDHLDMAIQTGPIIKENNAYQTLKIQNDSDSRRVVAGVTGENKLFFMVIYNSGSEYMGPNLGDLPNVLANFEQKTGIAFADVINLDGGAASTFNTSAVKLSEISPVGAFFCQP